MGLDMYIFRKQKVGNIEGDGEELVYWRKANQIRQWFVEHTDLNYEDDCKEIPLTRDNIVQLIEDCQAVLDNHDLAEEILPTEGGFFFGSTEYDEYYFDDLEYTVKELTRLLEEVPPEDFDNGFIYYYEWW